MRIMGLFEIPSGRPRVTYEYSKTVSFVFQSHSIRCRRQSKTFDSEAIFTLAGVGSFDMHFSSKEAHPSLPQGRASFSVPRPPCDRQPNEPTYPLE